jgi:hypothetical protein
MRLTPRGEKVAVIVGLLVFLLAMGIVGSMDLAAGLPNDR